MSIPKIILILGAGPNIGAATAKAFAARGYSVALAARSLTAGTSKEGYTTIPFDASRPASVKDVFAATRTALGTPSVVLFSLSGHVQVKATDPFAMPVADFANALTVNVTSPYAAAVEALAGLEVLKEAGADLTFFFYTGNALNVRKPMPALLAGGTGKSASAHWIQVGAQVYGDKGAKFYYVDERVASGEPAFMNIDGDAHATEFLKLADSRVQHEPLYTFVKGVGYTKF